LKAGKKNDRLKEINFRPYIFNVLRQVHPDTGISTRAMNNMNSFVNDMLQQLAKEASLACDMIGKSTMTTRELQTAARILLPGEIRKHAISEAVKAVTKFEFNSKNSLSQREDDVTTQAPEASKKLTRGVNLFSDPSVLAEINRLDQEEDGDDNYELGNADSD